MDVTCDYYFPKPVWRTSLPKTIELEPIVNQIYQLEKKTKSRQRSNRGPLSFQSADFEYDADRKDDALNDLLFHIGSLVQAIHETDRRGEVILSNAWFNINRKDGMNLSHTHPGSMYSGVIWLKASEGSGDFVINENDDRIMLQSKSFYGRFKDPTEIPLTGLLNCSLSLKKGTSWCFQVSSVTKFCQIRMKMIASVYHLTSKSMTNGKE